METVQINIPETLYNTLRVLGYQKREIERELLEDMVIQLYAKHMISIGKAASIVGLSVQAFRDSLLKRSLPVEYLTEDVYEEDMEMISSIKIHNAD
jgi:predicted HTH domain antitoxin